MSDDSFVVAWSGEGPGDNSGAFLQRFDASGTKIGGEILVNATTGGTASVAGLDVDASDNIYVTWTVTNAAGSDSECDGQEVRLERRRVDGRDRGQPALRRLPVRERRRG